MVGAGFAAVENVLYGVSALIAQDIAFSVALTAIRSLSQIIGHPLYTGLFGAGVGLHKVGLQRGPYETLWRSMLLHAGWNFSATRGSLEFVLAGIITVVAISIWQLRVELKEALRLDEEAYQRGYYDQKRIYLEEKQRRIAQGLWMVPNNSRHLPPQGQFYPQQQYPQQQYPQQQYPPQQYPPQQYPPQQYQPQQQPPQQYPPQQQPPQQYPPQQQPPQQYPPQQYPPQHQPPQQQPPQQQPPQQQPPQQQPPQGQQRQDQAQSDDLKSIENEINKTPSEEIDKTSSEDTEKKLQMPPDDAQDNNENNNPRDGKKKKIEDNDDV